VRQVCVNASATQRLNRPPQTTRIKFGCVSVVARRRGAHCGWCRREFGNEAIERGVYPAGRQRLVCLNQAVARRAPDNSPRSDKSARHKAMTSLASALLLSNWRVRESGEKTFDERPR
jgi:hypothetical protein